MTNLNQKLIGGLFCVMLAGSNAFANENYEGSMKDIPHVTITFDANSSALSESNRNTLREVLQKAQENGSIKQVAIAAWSDKNLPHKSHKLSAADRNLAKTRADAIANYLKSPLALTANVDTYNMAETSNWLARTFRTSDAELKSLFSKKGESVPVTNAEFQVIKNEGGKSEAVVVIEKN